MDGDDCFRLVRNWKHEENDTAVNSETDRESTLPVRRESRDDAWSRRGLARVHVQQIQLNELFQQISSVHQFFLFIPWVSNRAGAAAISRPSLPPTTAK